MLEQLIATYSYGKHVFSNTNGVLFTEEDGSYSVSIMYSAHDDENVTSFNCVAVDFLDPGQDILETADVRIMLERAVKELESQPFSGKFTGTAVFSPSCLCDFVSNIADSFTGDLKFTLKLGNTGDVNAGAENACTVTITDKDHPLDPILGVWVAQAESIWYGAQKYDVTLMKDASDPYKVWIDNWGAKDGWNGDDTVIYGVVSEDLTTITIPFGQATEYVYSNGEACLYEGVDSSLNTYESGEWILSISDDKKSMVETAGYGVYYYIPGAGGLQALIPGITLSR